MLANEVADPNNVADPNSTAETADLAKDPVGWVTQNGEPAIVALIILVVAWVVSGWVGKLIARSLERSKVDRAVGHFLGSMVRWTIMIVALVACLSKFGVETTSFAAVLGAAGLAIGLAMQGSLGNVAAGVMLMIFRPFKADDVVKVCGELGKVESIQLFCTQIDTPDNRRIILPNGAVFGSTIENITFHDTRRVDVAVGVEYTADLDRTREVLTSATAAVPGRIDEPAPVVMLLELGDSSVNWTVRVWAKTADYWDVRDALTREVKMALDNAGLGIPFPQMDVHLDKPAA